mmetsp:Transcript_10841/g.31089  ORF Transcript_10841/g.31089 Transcript_10841/m.31089 type:complete len:338 (-) Transcript_10841:152-1165(-)
MEEEKEAKNTDSIIMRESLLLVIRTSRDLQGLAISIKRSQAGSSAAGKAVGGHAQFWKVAEPMRRERGQRQASRHPWSGRSGAIILRRLVRGLLHHAGGVLDGEASRLPAHEALVAAVDVVVEAVDGLLEAGVRAAAVGAGAVVAHVDTSIHVHVHAQVQVGVHGDAAAAAQPRHRASRVAAGQRQLRLAERPLCALQRRQEREGRGRGRHGNHPAAESGPDVHAHACSHAHAHGRLRLSSSWLEAELRNVEQRVGPVHGLRLVGRCVAQHVQRERQRGGKSIFIVVAAVVSSMIIVKRLMQQVSVAQSLSWWQTQAWQRHGLALGRDEGCHCCCHC